MGLTIHWDLTLVGTTGKHPAEVLEALRQRALDMPFEEVSPRVYHVVGEAAYFERYRDNDPDDLFWALCQAQKSVEIPGPEGWRLSVPPKEAFLFTTWPGEECESANFGLAKYPAKVEHEGRIINTGLRGWRWHSFCKTQYASEVGVGHFLRCHAVVCSLLKEAGKLGIVRDVHDEGKFWGNGDYEALARTVGEWNDMIKSQVQAFRNMLSGSGLDVWSQVDSLLRA